MTAGTCSVRRATAARATAFDDLSGKWQAAILQAKENRPKQNRPKLRVVSSDWRVEMPWMLMTPVGVVGAAGVYRFGSGRRAVREISTVLLWKARALLKVRDRFGLSSASYTARVAIGLRWTSASQN